MSKDVKKLDMGTKVMISSQIRLLIQALETGNNIDDEQTKMLVPRVKALELLGKTKGLFLDRTDITTSGDKISWNEVINQQTTEKKEEK